MNKQTFLLIYFTKKKTLNRTKRTTVIFISLFTICTNWCGSIFAHSLIDPDFSSTQQQAINYIYSIKTIDSSSFWPHVKPKLFLENLKLNVHEPKSFYPGRSTNFCSYGAVSYLVINEDPLGYAKFMMALYRNGCATFRNTCFTPSEAVMKVAGRLHFKGVLDIRHAEQMWFLTLADHFKGYLNIFNRQYDRGDEDRFWAATNYGKFNRMVKKMTGYHLHAVGSDLMRPWLDDEYKYITDNLEKGIIVLYINNRVLHKKNHTKVKLGFPTHFVVLEKIYEQDGLITMVYWDYGSRTLVQFSPKILKKIIFGISVCTKNESND